MIYDANMCEKLITMKGVKSGAGSAVACKARISRQHTLKRKLLTGQESDLGQH